RGRIGERPTNSVAAYDAFLRAEATVPPEAAGTEAPPLRRAVAYYEQAVAADPSFAQAWARMAWDLALLDINFVPDSARARRALAAAERAVSLAPDRAAGHVARAFVRSVVFYDQSDARADVETARRLAPNDAYVLSQISRVEQRAGRHEDALRDALAAAALDPRSSLAMARVGRAYLWLRRYPA